MNRKTKTRTRLLWVLLLILLLPLSCDCDKEDGTKPTVTIISPINGSNYHADSLIYFYCNAYDAEDGRLGGESVVWTSSIDGEIGTDTVLYAHLSIGEHRITAFAEDSDGNTASARVNITVSGVEVQELVPIGSIATGGDAYDVAIDGNIAYLAAYDAGLFSIDISNPSSPMILDNYRESGSFITQVEAAEGYVYLLDYSFFRILEAVNPANLTPIHEYRDLYGDRGDDTTPFLSLYLKDSFIYMAKAGRRRANIANPYEPVYEGIPVYGFVNGFYCDDNNIYTVSHFWHTASTQGSQLIIVTNDMTETYPYTRYTNRLFTDVFVRDNLAYIAAWDDGVWIINVRNPAYQILLHQHNLGAQVANIFIWGDCAYLACGWDGLLVVDIRDPGNLVKVAEYKSSDYVREVTVVGGHAFVADGYNGLTIFDVSGFENLREVSK